MAKKSHFPSKKSMDSALFEKSSLESGVSTEAGHSVQESHYQTARLLSSNVMTLNDVRDRSSEHSSRAASSGVEGADLVVEGPTEVQNEACSLPHDPLHSNGEVLQTPPLHSSNGTTSISEGPLLEPAAKLSGQCTLASYFADGDPVSPGDENPPTNISPILSAHAQAAGFSFDGGSSASAGGAVGVNTPEKERKSMTEMVGMQKDSCMQTYKSELRLYYEKIILERDTEAVRAKEKAELDLVKVKQQQEIDAREKNAVIEKQKTELNECKIQNESLRQCNASLEKAKHDDKERYEARIKHLEGKVEEMKKNECTTPSVKKSMSEVERLDRLKTTEAEEERQKRLQVELELAKVKEENSILKAERERDAAKAKCSSVEED